jgi:hypothetical protein
MSHKHRLFHLLLQLTHQWGDTAGIELSMLHDVLCKRLANRRGEPYIPHGVASFVPRYSESAVYAEFYRMLEENGVGGVITT